MANLSRLKKVNLREVWNHEAYDFTQWLAEEENIELLGNEIGIEIIPLETEASVGRFQVDVLAEEANTGRNIIIENQLERTDHQHLGKLITYSAGIDASIIIWIVKSGLEEHQQAIQWLNEMTDKELNFFLVQIELWQIDNSNVAPKINVLEKPNYWSKDVREGVETAKLSDIKRLQLDFWTRLKEYSEANNKGISFRKPRPQHWYDISFGTSDAHIALTVNTQKDEILCEVYIPDSYEVYMQFYNHKEEIEDQLNGGLDWQELPEKKASRIRKTKPFSVTDNKDNWEEAFDWMIDQVQKFSAVFSRYI